MNKKENYNFSPAVSTLFDSTMSIKVKRATCAGDC